MSKKFLISVLVAFFLLNTGAMALVNVVFMDENDFASWNKKEILHMAQEGILTGYEDGTFKPNKNITRAEVAVIADRLRDNLVEQISEVIGAYESMDGAYFTFDGNSDDSSAARVAIAMGVAGLREIEGFDIESKCGLGYDKAEMANFNMDYAENYNVYRCSSLPGYLYYVNFKGNLVLPESGGEKADINEWYGPFEDSIWFLN